MRMIHVTLPWKTVVSLSQYMAVGQGQAFQLVSYVRSSIQHIFMQSYHGSKVACKLLKVLQFFSNVDGIAVVQENV